MTEHHLDANGLICPLPVLKARKKLLNLPAGDSLRVAVTDPAALKDFPLFCDENGYSVDNIITLETGFEVVIKKKEAS